MFLILAICAILTISIAWSLQMHLHLVHSASSVIIQLSKWLDMPTRWWSVASPLHLPPATSYPLLLWGSTLQSLTSTGPQEVKLRFTSTSGNMKPSTPTPTHIHLLAPFAITSSHGKGSAKLLGQHLHSTARQSSWLEWNVKAVGRSQHCLCHLLLRHLMSGVRGWYRIYFYTNMYKSVSIPLILFQCVFCLWYIHFISIPKYVSPLVSISVIHENLNLKYFILFVQSYTASTLWLDKLGFFDNNHQHFCFFVH